MSKLKNELATLVPLDSTSIVPSGSTETVEYLEDYGYGANPEDSGAGLSPAKVWQAIRRRKWLIALIVVVVTGAVAVQVYRIKPTYQASTIIEIGRENTSLVKFGDVLIQNDDTVKTKTYIVQSTPLLEDMVVELRLDQNQTFLSDFDPVGVTYTKNSLPSALKGILDRVLLRNEHHALTVITPDTSAAPLGENSLRPPAERDRLEPFVGVVKKNLTIEVFPDTRLIQISFTHPDPAIAAAVVNSIVQNFIQRGFGSKTDKLTRTSDWLEATTHKLKEKVEQAEQALASYTKEHNIFPNEGRPQPLDPEKPANFLATDKLTTMHMQVTRAETDRMLKESLYEEVKQGRIAQIPEAFTDPTTAELRKKLAELSAKMAQLEVNFGPENPQIVETSQEMAGIRKELEANAGVLGQKLQADYDRAVRDERAFKGALDVARKEAAQENQDAIRYAILKEEVDTTKSLYKNLLEKTSQASFEVAQQSNNVHVIEPARPPKLSSAPDRQQSILLGFGLSLAAGIGLAVLLQRYDKTINNVEDVTQHGQLRALAVIPAINEGPRRGLLPRRNRATPGGEAGSRLDAPGGLISIRPGQPMRLEDHSMAAEAYRLLRTSMVLSSSTTSFKTLLMTSSQSGEGKTTTCINTAISLAQLGKSVVVIDCDMRTPSVDRMFGLKDAIGLSNYLYGEVELSKTIRASGLPHLSVIPAGPIPNNPTELLSSTKLREALKMLSERYDHIMIDSPPLTNLADSIILSTLVDGVILVVRGGKTSREQLWLARNCLQAVGANIFGVVLNDAESDVAPHNPYYIR
jgi:succinoglycan biosynthesis transport protein ExoP